MAGRVLNNDEVVTAHALATLTDEQMIEPVECWAVTRPLKLGTTEFKRLETVVARIMSQDCFAHIIVEGRTTVTHGAFSVTHGVTFRAWMRGCAGHLYHTSFSGCDCI